MTWTLHYLHKPNYTESSRIATRHLGHHRKNTAAAKPKGPKYTLHSSMERMVFSRLQHPFGFLSVSWWFQWSCYWRDEFTLMCLLRPSPASSICSGSHLRIVFPLQTPPPFVFVHGRQHCSSLKRTLQTVAFDCTSRSSGFPLPLTAGSLSPCASKYILPPFPGLLVSMKMSCMESPSVLLAPSST